MTRPVNTAVYTGSVYRALQEIGIEEHDGEYKWNRKLFGLLEQGLAAILSPVNRPTVVT